MTETIKNVTSFKKYRGGWSQLKSQGGYLIPTWITVATTLLTFFLLANIDTITKLLATALPFKKYRGGGRSKT